MRRFRRPSPGVVLGGLALIVATSGVAVAAIPSRSEVISACYSKKTGAVRVVDKTKKQKCRKGEKSLSWNQTGQTGPAGASGAPGATGPQGPPGDPGTTSGITTLVNGDWATNQPLTFDFANGGTVTYFVRKATIAVPSLTQAIIDHGSVEVAVRPDRDAQDWTPLPFQMLASTGIFAYRIEVRYSVGQIALYFNYVDNDTDDGFNAPNVNIAALADLPVRWVVRPGA